MYGNVEKGLGDNISVKKVIKFFQEVNDIPFWVRPKLSLPSQGPCQDHHGATPPVGMGILSHYLAQRCAKLGGGLRRSLGSFRNKFKC
jgi:hypothetical protein